MTRINYTHHSKTLFSFGPNESIIIISSEVDQCSLSGSVSRREDFGR
jgi:hypothetical protein